MGELFGTDGVRGVAHGYPMISEMALNIGGATAYLFKRTGHSSRIILEKIPESPGICSKTPLYQASVQWGTLLVGPMPTQGIAFLTSSMRADAETEKYCKHIADAVRKNWDTIESSRVYS
jgi:phosphoglucosamine mutase